MMWNKFWKILLIIPLLVVAVSSFRLVKADYSRENIVVKGFFRNYSMVRSNYQSLDDEANFSSMNSSGRSITCYRFSLPSLPRVSSISDLTWKFRDNISSDNIGRLQFFENGGMKSTRMADDFILGDLLALSGGVNIHTTALDDFSGSNFHQKYHVQPNDNLYTIARNFKVSIRDIVKLNGLSNLNLVEGQVLYIKDSELENRIRTPVKIEQSFVLPVRYDRLSSGFGYRIHPIYKRRKFHNGVDFSASYGRPILAAADGRVVFSGYQGGYGRLVIVKHDDNYSTFYAHCSALLVSEGERITSGQRIATIGSSGLSTGPHLHFGLKYRNQFVDPMKYFL